jgi:hypothetical protein
MLFIQVYVLFEKQSNTRQSFSFSFAAVMTDLVAATVLAVGVHCGRFSMKHESLSASEADILCECDELTTASLPTKFAFGLAHVPRMTLTSLSNPRQ